jgi:hypothetical protein
MHLEGSCHCGAVTFALESHTPYPFNRCYCTVCRKTAGGGGCAINIMGEAETLAVDGVDHVTVYQARGEQVDGGAEADGLSHLRRHFCALCGSQLWAYDPRWPQWVYPFASAIDTKLPTPPEHVHLMLGAAAPWVEVASGPGHDHFDGYPDEAIIDWHRKRGLLVK